MRRTRSFILVYYFARSDTLFSRENGSVSLFLARDMA